MADPVSVEHAHRLGLWKALIAGGGTKRVPPARLRQLGIYGGAQGVWVDKERTRAIDPSGVTVAVLHTGSSYADDIYDGGVLYHYPTTHRPPGRDAAEVEATKSAHELELPVFVISYPTPSSSVRNVDLAWVEAWDDAERLFLISYGDEPPPPAPPVEAVDNAPFELTQTRTTAQALTTMREGQHRFKFNVLRRYGASCAVCDVAIESLLDAAHLREVRDSGTDDARNGVVLCSLHHRAYDRLLFGIDPATLSIVTVPSGPTPAELRMTRESLAHLPRKPHPDALGWRWKAWQARTGST